MTNTIQYTFTRKFIVAIVVLFLSSFQYPNCITATAFLATSKTTIVQNHHPTTRQRNISSQGVFQNTLQPCNQVLLTCVASRGGGGGNEDAAKRQNKIGSMVTTIGRMYERYMELLEEKPLWTNSISSGIITALGDILSQWIEKAGGTLDVSRLISFTLAGTIFVGPYVYYWYGYLWKLGRSMENKFNTSKQLQSCIQNIVDQTIGVVLFFPTYFYVYEFINALCSLRAPSWTLATGSLRQEIISVIIMQYKVWLVANWINFTYVPEKLRVLVSNIVAVFWSAYLSMRMT